MGTEAFLKIQEAAGCPSCCLNDLEKEAKPRGRAEKKKQTGYSAATTYKLIQVLIELGRAGMKGADGVWLWLV